MNEFILALKLERYWDGTSNYSTFRKVMPGVPVAQRFVFEVIGALDVKAIHQDVATGMIEVTVVHQLRWNNRGLWRNTDESKEIEAYLRSVGFTE